jgi:hypothetical protein
LPPVRCLLLVVLPPAVLHCQQTQACPTAVLLLLLLLCPGCYLG